MQTVTVNSNFFSPTTFNILLGDSVKWIWVSGQHTTTSTTIPVGATAWNHNMNSASTTFIYVPNKVGTYNYMCNFHTNMIASFVVGCPTPVVSITNPVPIVACSGTTILLNSSASGGAPFTYQWQLSTNGGANWSNAGGATNSNYAVVATTSLLFYRVVVTNSCQNTGASQAISISVQTIAIGVTPFQSSVCAGSCVTLVAANSNGGTIAGAYTWSPSNSLNSSTGATVVACPTISTTYTVTFVSSIGCSGTANAFVGVNANPVVAGVATDYSVCAGTTTQLLATGTGALTYSWSPATGLSNPNISNPLAVPTVTTVYTVTVTNSSGCTGFDTVKITVGPGFQLSQTHVNTTCGLSNGSIDLTVSGGTSPYIYSWSNGATTQDLTNIPAGGYAVTVSSGTGCTNVLTMSVSNSSGPTLTVNPINSSCGAPNGGIDLAVTGGTAPYSYQWSNGANTQDLTGLFAGTYIVTVTDANGCTSAIYAIISNAGNISLAETHVNASCNNASGSINLTVTNGFGPFTYHWNNNATTEDLTGLTPGTYTVTVTTTTGCSGTLNITITNQVPPTLTQTHVNASCGNANGSINLTTTPTGNYFYFWSNGASTEDIGNLLAGTYTVTVYSSGVGCVSTLSVIILNANSGTLTQTHVNASCGNANGSINLSVSPAGNYNYLWSNGATTQDINNLSSGTYTVTVSNSTGCSNSLSVIVTGTNAPVIIASAANAGCGLSNGYIVTTVSGGVAPYSYVWNTGATTSLLQQVPAGVYSVTVYDQNQCSGTTTITVGSNPPTTPVVSIQSGTASFCAGGNAVLAVSPLGSSFQWTKNNVNINGATNSTYTASVSGTFRCVVTYSGCGAATSNGLVITKLATPTAVITSNGPTTFCAGQSVVLSVNAQAGVSYQWRKGAVNISGATNSTYTATAQGNYRCMATAISTGCTKLSNVIGVIVNCKLEVTATSNTFKYYPNPFTTQLTVQLTAVSTISVYNVLGQKLIEIKDVDGEIKIGSELKEGMYFLELRVNDVIISSQRIVKVE